MNKLTLPSCLDVKGRGTSDSPYEIHSVKDFVCMANAPDAYWNLKTDLVVKPSDYQSGLTKRFVPIPCFAGVFDGEFHKIRHEVNCASFDCTGEPLKVDIKVALIGRVLGFLMNLHIEADYRNLKPPFTKSIQSVSGLAHWARDAIFLRISMTGYIDADVQNAAGLIIEDDEINSAPNGSLLEQVSADFVLLNQNLEAANNTLLRPQHVAGLVHVASNTVISNSVSKYDAEETMDGADRSGLYLGRWTENRTPKIRNSYHRGNFVVQNCREYDFRRLHPLGIGGDVSDSFWTGQVRTGSGEVCNSGPDATLQRNGAALTGVFDEFQFSTDYWVRGADGLPRLKWLE